MKNVTPETMYSKDLHHIYKEVGEIIIGKILKGMHRWQSAKYPGQPERILTILFLR
jgi:hypothetical protein